MQSEFTVPVPLRVTFAMVPSELLVAVPDRSPLASRVYLATAKGTAPVPGMTVPVFRELHHNWNRSTTSRVGHGTGYSISRSPGTRVSGVISFESIPTSAAINWHKSEAISFSDVPPCWAANSNPKAERVEDGSSCSDRRFRRQRAAACLAVKIDPNVSR